MKIIFIAGFLISALLLASCEFFSSEQEESGINPKPFNSQASWETNPYPQLRN